MVNGPIPLFMLASVVYAAVGSCHQDPATCFDATQADEKNSSDAVTLLQVAHYIPAASQAHEGSHSLKESHSQHPAAVLRQAKEAANTALATSQAKQLSNRLLAEAQLLPADSPTRVMFESFRICGQCSEFKRFGDPGDGGYLTCMDGSSTYVAAVSLGVEDHDQWSNDVASVLGLSVAQFDCTVDAAPSDCDGKCKFYKQCLVSQDNIEEQTLSPHVTLLEAMRLADLSCVPEQTLLMKMDIEGSEWPILATEPQENLKMFGQIIIEFHWLNLENKHNQYVAAVQNVLAAGFKVVHLHGNNVKPMYSPEPGASIPTVLEVTFSAHVGTRNECLPTSEYIADLDASNTPGRAELPDAQLR